MAMQGLYRLGDKQFSANDSDVQSILKTAHKVKSRPVCLCNTPHPEMYVAQVGRYYILKRMPGTGHTHAPSCHTFDPPPEVSGLGHVTGKAIVDGEDGETLLKLGFSLSIRDGKAPPAPGSGEGTRTASLPATKLSLLGLLHYLWDEAELTKWRPAMRDKRNWWIVRRELLAAAAHKNTRSTELGKILYIPESFQIDRKDQIEATRRSFMHSLLPVKEKPQPLGLMIGEYKGRSDTSYGQKLQIKHAPDFPFLMDRSLVDRFEKIIGDYVLDLETYPKSHLMLIATFTAKEHRADIREIAGMLVSDQWLPYEHDREFRLINAMLDRSFTKCMRYNLGRGAAIASALLLDCETPTALYTTTEDMNEDETASLEEIASDGKFPYWIWKFEETEVPALPIRASKQKD